MKSPSLHLSYLFEVADPSFFYYELLRRSMIIINHNSILLLIQLVITIFEIIIAHKWNVVLKCHLPFKFVLIQISYSFNFSKNGIYITQIVSCVLCVNKFIFHTPGRHLLCRQNIFPQEFPTRIRSTYDMMIFTKDFKDCNDANLFK